MKLLRYGPKGQEKPGTLDRHGRIRDLSGMVRDIAPDVFAPSSLDRLRSIDPETLPVVETGTRVGACVADVPKLLSVDLNYRDRAEEARSAQPAKPQFVIKSAASISGPDDDVILPIGAEKADWEAELGIVMGSEAQNVAERDWHRYVAGYCIVNNVSDRATEGNRQWSRGKTFPTFCPTGPWLVTADELTDPQKLDIVCEINGDVMQKSSTRWMIFGCAELVSYLSHCVTLTAGDVILTGTPAGVGLARDRYLRPGDTMRLKIAGLGEQRQRVRRRAGATIRY